MTIDKNTVLKYLSLKYKITTQEADIRLTEYKKEIEKYKYTYQNDRNKLVQKVNECQRRILKCDV